MTTGIETRPAHAAGPDAHRRRRFGQPSSGALIAAAMVVVAVAIGAATAVSPILGLAMAGGLAFVYLLSLGQRMIPLFHGALVVVCIGLAFFGRGFAYIGVRPLYVSELVLGLAVVAILVSLRDARWRPIHLAIAVFMGWGIARTIPYVATYDIDALRDGVIFGYALFAYAVSATVRREHVERLMVLYRRWFPLFMLWVPIAAVSASLFIDRLPFVPGSTVPIIVFKAGDTGVHLGAFGAFMLLGLGGGANLGGMRDWAVWSLWFLALAMSSIISRGGMVAASMMAASVLFARASGRWISLVLVGVFLLSVVALADPQIEIGRSRTLSVEQAVDNVLSIVGLGQDDRVLEITKSWRLAWWDKIIGYTLEGPYFWDGKGFGINLADSDGFQVEADGSLRAPHNGHLVLLARGGVPMLALWIVVQLTYFVTLIRGARRAHAAGLGLWVRVVGWIFVYWLAALVNAAFDVYLEGPMGGIWFWSMMGLGIAVVRIIDDEIAEQRSAAAAVRSASAPAAPGPPAARVAGAGSPG